MAWRHSSEEPHELRATALSASDVVLATSLVSSAPGIPRAGILDSRMPCTSHTASATATYHLKASARRHSQHENEKVRMVSHQLIRSLAAPASRISVCLFVPPRPHRNLMDASHVFKRPLCLLYNSHTLRMAHISACLCISLLNLASLQVTSSNFITIVLL